MRSFIVSLILLSCASYKSSGEFILKENISYGEHERHKGDFYQSKNDNASLVIIVHGGGWKARDKSDMRLIAESLATNGFHVFNINYRLAPEYKHPAPIEDLDQAIQFAFKNFEFKGTKVGLWGYSAGAHISLLHALQNENIAAVVSGGAPYDLSWYEHSPYIVPYLGFDREGHIQEYLEASPIHYLHEKAPPMFLYHGIEDDLVEHAQMRVFYTRAKLKSLEVKTYDVSFWGHVKTFVFASKPVELGVKFLKEKLNSQPVVFN